MNHTSRNYRGYTLDPLVFPRSGTRAGLTHNYDDGFDAAVRIAEAKELGDAARTRVVRLKVAKPFSCAGDARRAALLEGEQAIDAGLSDGTLWATSAP